MLVFLVLSVLLVLEPVRTFKRLWNKSRWLSDTTMWLAVSWFDCCKLTTGLNSWIWQWQPSLRLQPDHSLGFRYVCSQKSLGRLGQRWTRLATHYRFCNRGSSGSRSLLNTFPNLPFATDPHAIEMSSESWCWTLLKCCEIGMFTDLNGFSKSVSS